MPALVIEYTDPIESFQGWLAIDRLEHRLCAGGMRVQPGLTRSHMEEMARNMTRKMQIADLAVDGAKCGIDYDPCGPGKGAAIRRFLQAIMPYVTSRYSLGPDLNVDMAELETAGRDIGLASVKMAIARAQGWQMDYFLERSSILDDKVGNLTLGQLRAGYGVAAAALGALHNLGIPPDRATVSIQGFGTLGRATLFGLAEAGCRIIAVADQHKCLISESSEGLPIAELLQTPPPLLPEPGNNPTIRVASNSEIFDCRTDLIIPAALENTVTPEVAERLCVRAVVPGANLAVPEISEELLHRKNILVLPDFLAGCGGSLSMEGLYGPKSHPTPREVLDHVRDKMQRLVQQVLERSRTDAIMPRAAALKICSERPGHGDRPPYRL